MDIIKTINLTKEFGPLVANDHINLTVKENEVKAIVGENGAGKSTLMNMLYGLIKPTSGEIYVENELVALRSPNDAISRGIGMVHQHFKLVPSLTVFENILLGVEINKEVTIGNKKIRLPGINRHKELEVVKNLIDKYELNINPDDEVKKLSIGAKQKVEILKMLYRQVKILIFDEPTAVLTPQEILVFYTMLRNLKAKGTTIILITHKLQEVIDISDSVTVIKKGKVVANLATKNTTKKQLAQLMVGRDVLLNVSKTYADYHNQESVYRLEHVSTINRNGVEVVSDVSLNLHRGEIVGIAGVEGNGQSELLDLMSGLLQSTQGKVFLHNQDITNVLPEKLRKKHMAFIPEDRYEQGLCRDMTICDNMIAGYHDSDDICHMGFISAKKKMDKAERLATKYDIRLNSLKDKISSLSGGNAQKVIIAREFASDPDILIAAQPTRGVDIGAIEYIHKSLLDLQNHGKSILLVSSELSEIMSLSDRILVMYKGRIIGQLDAKNASREEVGYLMMGIIDNKEGGSEHESQNVIDE